MVCEARVTVHRPAPVGTVRLVTGKLARRVLKQVVDTTQGCTWARIDPNRNRSNWPADGLPRLTNASSTLETLARAVAWFVLTRERAGTAARDVEWQSVLRSCGVPEPWIGELRLPEPDAPAASGAIAGRAEQLALRIWGDASREPLYRLAQMEFNTGVTTNAFDRLVAAEPQIHTGRWAVAPAATQLGLDEIRPIDMTPLRTLLEAFDVPFAGDLPLTLPLTAEDRDALDGLDRRLAHHIADVRTDAGGLRSHHRDALTGVFDHLRNRALVERSIADLQDADVVVVPGVRQTVHYRLDRALDLATSASRSPYILLTGQRPSYEAANLDYSEAGAMAEYVLDARHGDVRISPDRLLIEDRSRTYRENVFLSFEHLQRVAIERGRPLTVVLITAPYSLRRLHLIAAHQWDPFPHVVGRLLVAHGRTNWSLGSLLDPATPGDYFVKGVTRWVNECLKLIGGRVVGEF